ncbi:MAG: hypothetical protein HY077_11385 [Elusimicrobia bacterium]|nr:hypothetical protein [Elusimicrobiota bacterium]
MKNLLIASLLVAAAVPARAGISVGAAQTFGSQNYRGTKADASLDLTDDLYIAPSFSLYRSDVSSGTFYKPNLRVGYEKGPLSFGVEGGFQPKVNGYRQTSVGADATFSLAPGGTKHGHRMAGPSSESNETFGYGLAGVDVGAAFTHIQHYDDFSATGLTGAGLRRAGARRATVYTVGQNDLTAFAGAKFLITEVSGSITKSRYDKDLNGGNARVAQFLALSGFGAIEQGFPDTSYNLKMKWKTLPFVRPYVSYTHTTFKLGETPSNAVELGGNVGLDMLNVKAAWEHYTQSGYADQNYATIGASLNF